jgi:methylglutaconyl-CoA hydratase
MLARPEKRNAFDAELISRLTAAFGDVGDARAVVLAAEGDHFSAGADLAWMRSSGQLPFAENVADAMRSRELFVAVNDCPAPVVVSVRGFALGGAVGLVACADVAIAHENAVFGLTEVRVGLIPAMISPFVIARIGEGQTRRYGVTAERFDAAEAKRIGLVHEVVQDLEASTERVVGEILQGGPEAVRAAKRLVLDHPLGAQTAERIAKQRASEEGQEGLNAFLEKRTPSWHARMIGSESA